MEKWTEQEEILWKELTDKREKNKKAVGQLHTISTLKNLISDLENDIENSIEYNIEFIRDHATPYAYEGLSPVIGKKITIYFNFRN